VKADIEGLKNVADIVRGLSLPTELLVNECNAEVVPVDKSLRRRSRKMLMQPKIQI
jgi:sulfur carrier protein ThiS